MEKRSKRQFLFQIFFLFMTMGILIVTILIFGMSTKSYFRKQADGVVKNTALETALECDSIVGYAESSLSLVANALSEFSYEDFFQDHQRLFNTFAANTPFDYFQFCTSEGINTIDGINYVDVSDRPYFQDGIKGNSGIWINYTPRVSKYTLIDFYTPVYFDGEIKGVLLGILVNNSKLQSIMQSYFYDYSMVSFLLDENFGVISSTEESMRHNINLRDYQNDDKMIADIISHCENSNFVPFKYMATTGKEGRVCIVKTSKAPWYVVHVVTPKSLEGVMNSITNKTLIVVIIVMIVLGNYLVLQLSWSHNSLASKQRSHLNLIQALSSSFQNLFVINIKTSRITIYNKDQAVSDKYKDVFQDYNYESSFMVYAQNEVYEDDKVLFYTISTVEKVANLLSNTNEYSFVYRVLRNGEIHYFQCMLYKPTGDTEEFIATFKNVDNLMLDNTNKMELENIQEALHSAQWTMDYDKEGVVVHCQYNDALRRMLGYNMFEFPDVINSWLGILHPDDRDRVLNSFNSVIEDSKGKATFDETYRMLTKSKVYRWYRTAARVTRRQDGSPNHLTGLFLDVTESQEQLNNLSTMAGIYFTFHSIDLETNECIELNADAKLTRFFKQEMGAREQFEAACQLLSDKYVKAFKDFYNLDTLPERLKGKKSISQEFIGKTLGWIRCTFITVSVNDRGYPNRVIVTTQIIDDEKKREETLIRNANTDELTQFKNRHAYEEAYSRAKINKPGKDFVYISMDVNGLKTINDTLGHESGDEYIKGAVFCMDRCFGRYGDLYRIGGDEFVGMLNMTRTQLKDSIKEFKKVAESWSGNLVKKLSVSVGYISVAEDGIRDIEVIAREADQKMYRDKELYYSKNGVDRRGNQEAFEVLANLYTKMLKINITEDTYSVIKMDNDERVEEKGFAEGSISEWLQKFAESGQVYPADRKIYLSRTKLDFMRKYFRNGKQQLVIYYHRMIDGEYRKVAMEIMRAKNYTDSNQELFLYVQEIGR